MYSVGNVLINFFTFRKLFVGGLSWETTESEYRQSFQFHTQTHPSCHIHTPVVVEYLN